jgi:hypothetical protein
MQHAWYQKWVKWRRLRPEVFGLWVDNVMNARVANARNYNISSIIFNNAILQDIEAINVGFGAPVGTVTLPLTFPEGSPSHGAYPAGHATLSGACATILKIFFHGEDLWSSYSSPIQSNNDGTALIPYVESDANSLTVNGEIEKMAYNISLGRDWAGVHYRTDGIGIELGEEVAIRYFQDILASSAENNPDGSVPCIRIRRFNGDIAEIKPTTCLS